MAIIGGTSTTGGQDEAWNIGGAGFAGLVLAHHLRVCGKLGNIYEASHQPGGLLRTQSTPHGPVEWGANGIVYSQPLEAMLQRLGLEAQPSRREAAKRLIFRGSPRRWPFGPLEVARLARGLLSTRVLHADTLGDFVGANFGKGILNYLAEPAFQGIYAAHANTLALDAVFPGATQAIRGKGTLLSRLRSLHPKVPGPPLKHRGTVSFAGGQGQLIGALAKDVDQYLKLGKSLPINDQDNTVLAMPAHAAAQLLDGSESATLLGQVVYLPLVSITVFFKTVKAPAAFGCLFPQREGHPFLGVLFNSAIFGGRAAEGLHSATFIGGGTFDPKLLDKSDGDLASLCLKELKIFSPDAAIEATYPNRWPSALPHYTPAHMAILAQLKTLLPNEFPNLRLFGNYTGALSQRGMLAAAATWATT